VPLGKHKEEEEGCVCVGGWVGTWVGRWVGGGGRAGGGPISGILFIILLLLSHEIALMCRP